MLHTVLAHLHHVRLLRPAPKAHQYLFHPDTRRAECFAESVARSLSSACSLGFSPRVTNIVLAAMVYLGVEGSASQKLLRQCLT